MYNFEYDIKSEVLFEELYCLKCYYNYILLDFMLEYKGNFF